MFGDGDCGQLGLGEEVTERLRPWPVSVEGKKVGFVLGCPSTGLASNSWVAGRSQLRACPLTLRSERLARPSPKPAGVWRLKSAAGGYWHSARTSSVLELI